MLYKKTAEATSDLMGNKITNVLQNSQQNYSETVTNKNDKEIPKERHISPEEKHKIIDNLGLNIQYNSIILEYQKVGKFVRIYTKSTI